jgi:thiamine-monophosphate kinase
VTEFELIARWFTPPPGAGVLLGVGDDAALLAPRAGEVLAAATDTLVEGIHFPSGSPPRSIGHRALAVNLSDLAAMGAEPRWALLALTLPALDERWLDGFAAGFAELAARSGCALVGGDTTRGPLAVTVTVLGAVPAGGALRRAGARVGDALCVSGTLGDGAGGLRAAQGDLPPGAASDALRARFELPEPRLALGRALRGVAHACIDVSDGLVADLGHLLSASGVGATVEVDALPTSDALRAVCAAQARELALTGGDDYELAFACAPEALAALGAAGVALTRIGTVEAAPGLRLVDGAGRPVTVARGGHDHFA